ncbi:6-phosphogluconolactonase [Schizosaccharomyces japonicus yFS275]|uniref:6-phosphogluconolactonase n=1 Tax=Schizosaccharomyces japonicus (strain yFS275 / FY16936) TaxID=402676 RepID=B6JZ01_SCHJY|nr:6-phosphogluconolactonase [Schizosaccharomyces japonicus yFS275]EEB06769.1 6-phosphogluconolactonase [Schizosaccharomyces japonicus yFS275]
MLAFTYEDSRQVAEKLAEIVKSSSAAAIEKNGRFTIALSGGSLPKILAQGLAQVQGVDFAKWEVFFADERVVPLDHEDSTFHACQEAFFSKVGLKREQIHTLSEELLKENEKDVQNYADEYEGQLVHTFANASTIKVPSFDLIVLGCGPDGHTCSLFPNHELLKEDVAWVAPITDSPKPPKERITLTLPVVTHAHQIVFVATGAAKKTVIKEILEDATSTLPSALITQAAKDRTTWLMDNAASENLSRATLADHF